MSQLLPSYICKSCEDKVTCFHNFQQDVSNKQMTVNRILDRLENDNQQNPFTWEPEMKLDIKTEPFEFSSPIAIKIEPDAIINVLSEENVHNADQVLVQSSKENTCPICFKLFKYAKDINPHIKRMHLKQKNQKCQFCNYEAFSKTDIKRHQKAHHLPAETNPKDLRICPHCGKSMRGTNKLNYHIKIKHLKVTRYNCDQCSFQSYGKCEIRQHLLLHHLPLETRKLFHCDQCSSVLTTARGLEDHKILKHSGSRSHVCYCGKNFPLKGMLQKHIKFSHQGERRFICTICNKGYNFKQKYLDHMNNIHGNPQSIPCPTCGKLFKSSINLKSHAKYHSEPQFKCSHCSKMFYERFRLEEHCNASHYGKTFNCIECNKTFQSSSGLLRHVKSHK